MTHDLIVSLTKIFQISVKEVIIHDFLEGVFYANICVEKDGKKEIIDSRTSDAIAIAIRYDAKIFTNEKIMQEVGLTTSEADSTFSDEDEDDEERKEFEDLENLLNEETENDFSYKEDDELQEMLEKALEEENYILAAKIRDEINSRK
jgi:bifunctional DNase/RNase